MNLEQNKILNLTFRIGFQIVIQKVLILNQLLINCFQIIIRTQFFEHIRNHHKIDFHIFFNCQISGNRRISNISLSKKWCQILESNFSVGQIKFLSVKTDMTFRFLTEFPINTRMYRCIFSLNDCLNSCFDTIIKPIHRIFQIRHYDFHFGSIDAVQHFFSRNKLNNSEKFFVFDNRRKNRTFDSRLVKLFCKCTIRKFLISSFNIRNTEEFSRFNKCIKVLFAKQFILTILRNST